MAEEALRALLSDAINGRVRGFGDDELHQLLIRRVRWALKAEWRRAVGPTGANSRDLD
jgi:hypothetical protein